MIQFGDPESSRSTLGDIDVTDQGDKPTPIPSPSPLPPSPPPPPPPDVENPDDVPPPPPPPEDVERPSDGAPPPVDEREWEERGPADTEPPVEPPVAELKHWSEPVTIVDNSIGQGKTPQVAINTLGNAVVVWSRNTPFGSRFFKNIYAKLYRYESNTWANQNILELDNLGDAINPHVAMDANNNIVAVWQQSDGTCYSTWANQFLSSRNSWNIGGKIIGLCTEGFDTSFPRVAMSSDGKTQTIWQQQTREGLPGSSILYGIDSKYLSSDISTWNHRDISIIDTTPLTIEPKPLIKVFENGDAISAWLDGSSVMVGTYYKTGDGQRHWASNRVLGSGSNNVSLAIDGNNKAIVVWNYDGNIQYSICNLTSCSASATLYSGRRAADLDVAMNKNGVAAIAWVQQTNDIMIRSANTAAERLVWSSAVAIDNNGGFGVLLASPKIGIDNNGNVIVVWAATLGPLSMGVFANQLGNKTNLWNNETAQKIDSHPPPFHLVQGLQLAVSESGNAVAVWEQGAGNIIASVLR